jgi:branched-subunit amino acid transport protein
MRLVGVILAMGIGIYALRIAGMTLCHLVVPPLWERALRFVPIALLSALVVSSLSHQSEQRTFRVIAAAVAGWAAHHTGRMWACILSGMAVYWLLCYVWGQA